MQRRFSGPVACEPRHGSWFTPYADALLTDHHIARAAADPACVAAAAFAGGWPGLSYHRLHGSPHMYRSGYGLDVLADLARTLIAADAPESWCIFDNTTLGFAAADALTLADLLEKTRM